MTDTFSNEDAIVVHVVMLGVYLQNIPRDERLMKIDKIAELLRDPPPVLLAAINAGSAL